MYIFKNETSFLFMDSFQLGHTIFKTGEYRNNTFYQAYKNSTWTEFVKVWGASNEMNEYKRYVEYRIQKDKKPIRKRTQSEKKRRLRKTKK